MCYIIYGWMNFKCIHVLIETTCLWAQQINLNQLANIAVHWTKSDKVSWKWTTVIKYI